MGKTKDLGHLAHIVTYDASNNITLPANLTVNGTITGYATTASLSSYATQSYVTTQISNLVASAPTTLDTLNELATALGNDPNFATTIATSIGTKVPSTRTITINGTAYDLSADRSWNITSMVYPAAGIAVSTGSGWGTSITDNSSNWNTAYSNRIQSASSPLAFSMGILTIQQANGSQGGFLSNTDWTTFNNKQGAITLTTTGASGAATFTSNTLNIPTYTLSGLGGVPTSRTITINGTAYDLSADRSWTVSGTDSTKMPLSGGTFTGLVTFNFNNTDAVEWPRIRFGAYTTGWDEGIIKASSAEGVFGRYGMGIHFDSARSFGIYTSGWTKVMGFKSDEVRSFVNLTVNGNSVIHAGNISSQSVSYSTSMSVQWVSSMNVSTGSPTVYRVDNGVGAAVNYAPLLHMAASDTMWQLQGSYGTSGNGTLYFRQGYSGSWGNWITMLSSANYTSYTDGRYWLNNGSWYADFGSYSFSRIFGNETSGGGFAIMTNPNNGGQTSILIDGGYYAGENGGHWSLNASNQYASRMGFYHDGSTMNFRTNNAVISTANIRVYPISESWAEGISFIMPTAGVWGGLRWQRQRGTNDGNWYIGFTALDSSDDLVFGANSGGSQYNNILRMTTTGIVSMQQASSGATLVLGSVSLSRVYNDSSRNSLVINAPYYPHLYVNATAGDSTNTTHGAVISMTGRIDSGYRRWSMGIANYNPNYFSIGWYDNDPNPHYGVGHSWGPGGKFIIDTSGNIWCTGDITAYGSSSDLRLKDIKGKVNNALEGVMQLNGYRFDWKEQEVKITTFKKDIGVVAQEVEKVFPELARTNDNGYMSVRYQGLTAVLIEAVKEQQLQIEELKSILNALTK